MSANKNGSLGRWHNVELFATPLSRPLNYTLRVHRGRNLWSATTFWPFLHMRLAYCPNLLVHAHPGFKAVWPVAAFDSVMMVLMGLIYTADWGVFGFQCYAPQMGQGSYGVPFPRFSAIHPCVYHYSLKSFIFCFTFDFASMAYLRSAEIDCSSVDRVICWYSYSLPTAM